ncbi:winged helix-turn-helix domain-containing protein [Candidatus Dojkabacteria bacterium]|nr:winged helix-turn-helix domain-containing protein [Candidatus Dojkabacteria bacterium]
MISEEILNRTVELIQSIEDKDRLKSLIAELITNEFQYPVTGVFEVDGDYISNAKVSGSGILLKKAGEILGTPFSQLRYDISKKDNVFGKSVITKRPQITKHVENFMPHLPVPKAAIKASLKALMNMYGVKELGIFPSFYRGKLYSCIIVGHKKTFTTKEIDLLRLIASQFAGYIAFYELTEGLKKQNKVLKKLTKLANEIMSTDPRDIAQTVDVEQKTTKELIENTEVVSNAMVLTKGKSTISIDLDTGEIFHRGKRLSSPLSYTEIKILRHFNDNMDKLVTRDDIAKILWGKDFHEEYSDWAISKAISRIRKKIKDNAPYKHIVTLKNRGFKLHTTA